MKISVVTVCFNAAHLIEDTIKSVVGQTYTDIEYIVIDGGSSDTTTDIIRKYAEKISYWISEPDNGIYDAMNKGIKAASGDYINFMNAGDKFSDDSVLSKVATKLGSQTIVSGNWRRCYADSSYKSASPKATEALRVEMPICHQATFTRLAYHKKHPFDSFYKYSADYAFFYKAWRNHQSFCYIDELIVDFLEAQGASTDNIVTSVMERAHAWEGEKNLTLRKLHLRYQIARIKTVKMLKAILNK